MGFFAVAISRVSRVPGNHCSGGGGYDIPFLEETQLRYIYIWLASKILLTFLHFQAKSHVKLHQLLGAPALESSGTFALRNGQSRVEAPKLL
jgi:hypothetical protein